LLFPLQDLEKIPESKFQTETQKLIDREITDLVGALFDPGLKDHPLWDDENVRHNAAQALKDFNQRVPGLTVILPKETGKCCRKYLPLKFGNTIKVDFPTEKEKQAFLYDVYTLHNDPHDWLRMKGLIDYRDEPEGKVEGEKPAVQEKTKEDDPWLAYKKPQEAFAKFRKSGVMPKDGLIQEEQGAEVSPEEYNKNFQESLKPYGG
jgi:hypothetical protein